MSSTRAGVSTFNFIRSTSVVPPARNRTSAPCWAVFARAAAATAAAQSFDPAQLNDPALKTDAIGNVASVVSAIPEVRSALIEFQRRFTAQPPGAVLDGRDIGTVIAPHALAKLFVTASAEVRAQRRVRELLERGMPAHFEDVLIDIRARDARDSGRDSAPLKQADDAELLDTSEMTIEEAIATAIALVEKRLVQS